VRRTPTGTDQTRQRILDAAEAELTAGSLSATRVATRAGVSRQAVYYHFGRLSQLVAGDEVVVHAGTYQTPGFYEVTWPGTAAQPIVIRAADGEAR
jgi:hypothetical protein